MNANEKRERSSVRDKVSRKRKSGRGADERRREVGIREGERGQKKDGIRWENESPPLQPIHISNRFLPTNSGSGRRPCPTWATTTLATTRQDCVSPPAAPFAPFTASPTPFSALPPLPHATIVGDADPCLVAGAGWRRLYHGGLDQQPLEQGPLGRPRCQYSGTGQRHYCHAGGLQGNARARLAHTQRQHLSRPG